MHRPERDEIVSLVLALEEVSRSKTLGVRGLQFMCHEASRMIRRLRPDLAFKEEEE